MSLDQKLPPITLDRAYDRVDAYGRLFGWPVRWRGPQPFLALENGLCAVTMPKLSAGPPLARLDLIGCAGPAMMLQTQRGPRVAVLAEIDGLVPLRDDLPRDVEVLAWGTLLPLPAGPRRSDITSEWITAPDPHRRWLPGLDAVLSGIADADR